MEFIGTDVPGHKISGSAHYDAKFGLTCSCGEWTAEWVNDGTESPIVGLQRLADAGLEHILRVQGLWPQEVRDEKGRFFGFQPRHCGEHRTVGTYRAWCYDENEWCYPNIACTGCQVDKS